MAKLWSWLQKPLMDKEQEGEVIFLLPVLRKLKRHKDYITDFNSSRSFGEDVVRVTLESSDQCRMGGESTEAITKVTKTAVASVQGRKIPLRYLWWLRTSPPFLICCVQTVYFPTSQVSLLIFKVYFKML